MEKWNPLIETSFTPEKVAGTIKDFGTMVDAIEENKFAPPPKSKLEKYTKKEQLLLTREIDRLERMIGGVSQLKKLPEAIFVVDIKHEATAVREARKKGVPIVALVDTNANPQQVTWPIPANDDATKSIELLTGVIAEAIIEAKKEAAAQAPTQQVIKSQA